MTDGVEGSSSSRIRGIRAADTALADRIQVKQTTPICWHISEYRAGNRLYGLIKDERVKANGNKHDRMSVAYPIRPFIVARQKPSICPKNISIRVAFATWSSNQRWSPMSPAIAADQGIALRWTGEGRRRVLARKKIASMWASGWLVTEAGPWCLRRDCW